MDKHRRKILKNSAILGVAGGLASVSTIFGLQGCDSKESKATTQSRLKTAQTARGATNGGIKREELFITTKL